MNKLSAITVCKQQEKNVILLYLYKYMYIYEIVSMWIIHNSIKCIFMCIYV